MKKDAAHFMNKALSQAIAAEQRGEVPVGAVVVRDGRVIARFGPKTTPDDPGLQAAIEKALDAKS